jgi:alkylated DNA repair protein (DNA oxidative demethylase)
METIFDGVYHFPNAISDWEQCELVALFKKHQQQVYVPKLKSGHSMNLDMTCFGKHWSAIDYKYHDCRVDFDQEPVAEMPPALNRIATRFSLQCFPEHETVWDIALMNFYRRVSTLGLHQDNSESPATLAAGHPVVSFSVGAGSIFRIGGLSRKDPHRDITLNNGDVLIFGGSSRLRYHGITKILDQDHPFMDELSGGRVNFTLRKY